jgi:hypothetical protein
MLGATELGTFTEPGSTAELTAALHSAAEPCTRMLTELSTLPEPRTATKLAASPKTGAATEFGTAAKPCPNSKTGFEAADFETAAGRR